MKETLSRKPASHIYSDIVSLYCRPCNSGKYPREFVKACTECSVPARTWDIVEAIKCAAPTRRRVPFYSDPRDNVPPAGYVVMEVYDNEVGIIAERQYKRALKNKYVNQACGIWYAVSFPVFVQRPDGSLYRPHSFEHDN